MLDHTAGARKAPTSILSEHDSLPIFDRATSQAADWHGDVSEKSFQVKIGGSIIRIETTHPNLPDWLIGVLAKLNELAELPANWDSYDARPVEQRALEHALDVIVKLMDVDTPPPQVGATVRGGIEFEWHRDNKDLEVQVDAPFQVNAYYYDQRTDEEWEENVGPDIDRVKPYLSRFTG